MIEDKDYLKKFVGKDEDHSLCNWSSGVHDCLTVGQGELDPSGFWERGCHHCARKKEEEEPEAAPVWPHTEEQLVEMGLR